MPKFAMKKQYVRVPRGKGVERYPVVWPEMPAQVPERLRLRQARAKRFDEAPLNGTPLTRSERDALRAPSNVHDDREHFLSKRFQWLGATDLVKAVGLGFGAMTPYHAALVHTGRCAPDPFTLRGYRCCMMGARFEDVALKHYANATGFTVTPTGFHVMPSRPRWLTTLYDERDRETPDLDFVCVTPDALVTLPEASSGGNMLSAFADTQRYARHGRVEVKTHVESLRSPWLNRAATVQMLLQLMVDKEHVDAHEDAVDWVDLCSYSCVTELSRSFSRGRRSGVPLQRCAAWRLTVRDESIWVTLCDMLRQYRETLDSIDAYSATTFPLTQLSWRALELDSKLSCAEIFSIHSREHPIYA
jgi:hypothetical protein